MQQLGSHVENGTAQPCHTATGGVVFEQDICHTACKHEVKLRRFQDICSPQRRGGSSWSEHVWPASRPFCKDQALCKHDLIVEVSSLPGSGRECWEGISKGSILLPDQKMTSGPLSQPEENLLESFQHFLHWENLPSSTGLDTPESLP